MTVSVRTLSLLVLLCLTVLPADARQRGSSTRRPAAPASSGAGPVTSSTGVKVVAYDAREIARVHTKLRYTTVIVLPKDEVIVEAVCGDAGVWVINGEQNLAFVKPSQEGARSNLSLVTESGAVYSFEIDEISEHKGASADLKVFVEPKDAAALQTLTPGRRLVAAQALEASQQELQAARAETERVKAAAKDDAQAHLRGFLSSVRYPYAYPAGKKPFFVRAMFHDDQFTYILARPEETPTLYEVRDGEPNLVNFEYAGGMFIVSKVLESGYLALGKKRLHFKRQE